MAVHRYQVRLQRPGATGFSTGLLSALWESSQLVEPPIPVTPFVRPTEGRTNAATWTVRVLDTSGTVTALLSTGDGRPAYLGRLVQVRRSVDGGSFGVIGAGRVSGATLDPTLGVWSFDVEDEGYVGRNNTVFNTTNTTRLYPYGPHQRWGAQAAPGKLTGIVQRSQTVNGKQVLLLQFDRWALEMPANAVQALESDLAVYAVNGSSNFQHTRVRIGNTDHPVSAFGDDGTAVAAYPVNNFLAGLASFVSGETPLRVWVRAASTTLTVLSRFSSAFLHQFTAPPTAARPLHIGLNTSDGIHPMALKKQLWDGAYQPSTAAKPRYSTAAFNNGSTGLLREPMPPVLFRIEGPETLGPWMEDKLNGPLGVVDLVDSSGRLRPRRMFLPNNAAISTTQFTEFTSTNLRPPFPTWTQGRAEQVTVLRYQRTAFMSRALFTNPAIPFERITGTVREESLDRAGRYGRNVLDVQAEGWPDFGLTDYQPEPGFFDVLGLQRLQRLVDYQKRDVFDRYGDGPIYGTMQALGAAGDAVECGDFVRLSVSAYPNAQTQARGGTRLVQILRKTWDPVGCSFDFLDAGPNLQPLSAPSVTLAISSQDRKHSIRATVGSLGVNGVMLQAAISSTQPPSTSSRWTPVSPVATTLGANVFRIGNRPAGSKTWVRAAAAYAGRLRSGWTVGTSGITTSGLTTPTGLFSSGVRAGNATVRWTNGEASYPVVVHVDTSTSASPSTANRYQSLTAGSQMAKLYGLTPNSKHRVWVRHADAYGGFSGTASTVFTTLSSGSSANYDAAPPLVGLWVDQGVDA